MADDNSFITKYRPAEFKDVIGQNAAVAALNSALTTGRSRTFLLVGPSGVGKTTLARIAATTVKCAPVDLLEVDAASKTGIDDMRAVTDTLAYRPLGGGDARVIIVDECHALSASAWKSLLKSLEEPPSWVYWFLCTTEPTKIPQNILTRCTKIELKTVNRDRLFDMLADVADAEKLRVSDAIIELCANQADGSPRQALSNLALCAEARDRAEAAELLRTALDDPKAVDLARALMAKNSWKTVVGLIAELDDVNPESIRHVIRAYVSKVVMGAKSEADAGRGLELLDCFSTPFHPSDGISPLLLACGKAVLNG